MQGDLDGDGVASSEDAEEVGAGGQGDDEEPRPLVRLCQLLESGPQGLRDAVAIIRGDGQSDCNASEDEAVSEDEDEELGSEAQEDDDEDEEDDDKDEEDDDEYEEDDDEGEEDDDKG